MIKEKDVHVARQPIFDVNLNVFAYELLFRSSFINSYDGTDGDQATLDVINNSFLLIGIDTLTYGKKAFINFTANSLKNNIPAMLPKEILGVEILETVIPDKEIIEACKKLKKNGYLLILDDFIFHPDYLPLIELADIIKVDFRITPPAERRNLMQRLDGYPIKFLAEKVETQEEFQSARHLGYSYFQGYFFCKPLVLFGKNLPGYKTNYLHILKEINQPEVDFAAIETIIKQDVSLSYNLLKLINAPIFGFRTTIRSLQQALALLGQKELIKWISLIALKSVANDKPGELILNSLIRAKFAEKLAQEKIWRNRVSDAFLMGMFSHIDVLLDRPMLQILGEIPLKDDIKQALLGQEHNDFSVLYQLIKTYEAGEWELYIQYVEELGIEENLVLQAYRESLIWAHDLLLANY
ncbi:EAL and modified HD-GYP domain-containing signal transduction protein [Propionispira arboris]|uniref:EAL and modified HD-GYP domain-containing signal transduction protein n=1 Tax=Propionispira arboris TaxID=84035 RepID=A0A1H6X0L3_9FIRM|nr:HDOD domain-containing protein [Propionispira arboris]SEJ18105.1 EAL and modified HD-GYP domain-containing signal transduction protein [Propionispira arboris]